MASRHRLFNNFTAHLAQYTQEHGPQAPLQVKQLAKDYCIQQRGAYDLTCRRHYYNLFRSYCFLHNIEFPGWGHLENTKYDPDNEFPDDPRIINLKRKYEARVMTRVREMSEGD